jgi:hypothetical protein
MTLKRKKAQLSAEPSLEGFLGVKTHQLLSIKPLYLIAKLQKELNILFFAHSSTKSFTLVVFF